MNKSLIKAILAVIIGLSLTGWAYAAQEINLGNTPSGVSLLNQTQSGLTLKIDIGSVSLDKITTKEGLQRKYPLKCCMSRMQKRLQKNLTG